MKSGAIERVSERLRRLTTRIARRLRQSDGALTAAQKSLLESLVEIGPMTIGALADSDRVSPATVSRIVDALEARNLVRRARDKRDRRIVYAVATREGRGLLEDSRRDPAPLGGLLAALTTEQIALLDLKLGEIERLLFSEKARHRCGGQGYETRVRKGEAGGRVREPHN